MLCEAWEVLTVPFEDGEQPKGFRAERCREIFELGDMADNDGSLSMESFPFCLSSAYI